MPMRKLAGTKWSADHNVEWKESTKEQSDNVLIMDPVHGQQQRSNIHRN